MNSRHTTLVTGGAGFIGSNFVELLFEKTDDDIIVLDVFTYAASPDNIPDRIRKSPRFQLIKGDIRDSEIVASCMKLSTRVVHFAAESHVTRSIVDDKPFFETDVMGTQTIADAVARNRSRIEKFVHISTSEVYGTADYAPMDERHPLKPCTPYAAAKAGADRLVYAYQKTYKLPTTIIRPFNNYGPRQHTEKLVPRFITAALRNEPLTVHGDGQMTRDWIFVRDTCEGVFRALCSSETDGETINLGTGIDVSVMTIAEIVLSITGKSKDLIQHVDVRPGQVDRHISSVYESHRLLNKWRTTVDLYAGLLETVHWYKENPAWWAGKQGQVEITDTSRKLAGSF